MQIKNETTYDIVLSNGFDTIMCLKDGIADVPEDFFKIGNVTASFDAVTTMKEKEERVFSLNRYDRRSSITTKVYYGNSIIKGIPKSDNYKFVFGEKSILRFFHKSSEIIYPDLRLTRNPMQSDVKCRFDSLKHSNDVETVRKENKWSLALSSLALFILIVILCLPFEASETFIGLWFLLSCSALWEFIQSIIQLRRFGFSNIS